MKGKIIIRLYLMSCLFVLFTSGCSPRLFQGRYAECIENTKAKELVASLDDSKVVIGYNYAPTLSLVGESAKLLFSMKRRANCSLLRSLEKGEHVLLSHILLSQINLDQNELFLELTVSEPEDGEELILHHYNGLVWSDKGIEEKSLAKVKEIWKSM